MLRKAQNYNIRFGTKSMLPVHICIPIYNVQDYLKECLDSALSQTYEDISVICVDDGSTDNSSAILTEYESNYPKDKLTVIRKPNGGLSSARNAALDYLKDKEGYIQAGSLIK